MLWRDSSSAAATNLIALREQISPRLRQGLFPCSARGDGGAQAATRPNNAEAYDLYLRSRALTSDPEPNKQAIAMLERSVGLDPSYAPRGRRSPPATTTRPLWDGAAERLRARGRGVTRKPSPSTPT